MATGAVNSSGLDVNGIVGQLMQIERRPLQALAQRETQVTARIAAYSRVQGAVSSLQNAAGALARATSFNVMRATVAGDGASAAVTDSAKAAAGSFQLRVSALAQAQAMATAPLAFAGANDVVGTGTLTLQVGNGAARTITITSANQTLAGVRDAINAAGAGVTAAIVTTGNEARLTLNVAETGAANIIAMTVTGDGDGDAADAAGLSRLATARLVQTRPALDAQYELNGLALTSASNKVTGAIEGVSLDLKKADPAVVSTITLARDNTQARSLVDGFIKSYNDLERVVRDATAFDPANRRGAILNGDGAVRSVMNQTRALVRAPMTPAQAGDFSSLSQIGIEVGLDGTLSLNATRFEAALSDPGRLTRLFTATSTVNDRERGFGVRFEAMAKSIVGADGLLPARTQGLQAQIESINKQEERLNSRLEQVEQRLRKQYVALDAQLQRLQGTSDSLANALRQLPGANTGSGG